MSNLPAEIQALVLAELAKRLKTSQAATKAIVGNRYGPGDKQTFRSPVDDAKLGTVFRSDPDPEWRVVAAAELDAFLADEDQGNTEATFEIVADASELIPLLLEHAPHLVRQVQRVTAAARTWAMDVAKSGVTVPGIAKVKPEGVLSVRPDKNAGTAIERMVEAGVITWDGRPVLEAGEVAS